MTKRIFEQIFLQRLVLDGVLIYQINSKHQNIILSPKFKKRLVIYMIEVYGCVSNGRESWQLSR